MFKKILIANRGEIACRIIKTAKHMGIKTVAVYSTIDRNSLHVEQADEAYCIGDAKAAASYLNIEAIIAASLASGAQAIHPGYGFLSENAEFAKACARANIVFIGPSIEALNAMGSKQLAKQLLEKTNVPLTPGYHGHEQGDDLLLQEAKKIGFPVLLKAANGGGGKGMRAVYQESEFSHALAGARRESLASFADDTIIIEKLIVNPRHIEIQIMADHYGEVVHLYERDCSIQRRHQKIIEEAPASHLSDELRQQLAQAACQVAQSIQYRGAGTVEFLVDTHEQFYFMEMNTRLQVEHPVTEMITGLDLVAWQLKIAANEPLPCKQDAIHATGHAIECRVYAEDPEQGFIPSIGQLNFLKEPTGQGIRIDTGVTCHSAISQFYDPMIAKLITWGENRSQALARMQEALEHFAIGGVKSNIPFLQAICQHPAFIDANITTHFLTEETIALPTPDKELGLLIAACYDYYHLIKQDEDALLQQSFAWQMHLTSSWRWHYLLEGQQIEVIISPINKEQFLLQIDEKQVKLRFKLVQGQFFIEYDGKVQSAWVENQLDNIIIYLKEGPISIERFSWEQTNNQNQQIGHLTAPMPATVVAILKKPGDIIKKGDQLLVLEAMKMEHTIHAPKDGIIAEFFYEIGSQVSEGAELLTITDCT
ncbi:acyl CoA carboxylase subunit alpha [Legionella beliardensis]|uniref:Biotin carboxylase n=1 Tax=Legionella beliardensis TaxID=91822 RepID=A0A378IBA2_9GAMM|nr:acetyl/propionyl/methylcrotonyl-CoA carboxylase subunit alpha [Legionella beliardensis]STX29584.1 acyl CoA carboxylase subunit alpha [Legionella beliardensis]